MKVCLRILEARMTPEIRMFILPFFFFHFFKAKRRAYNYLDLNLNVYMTKRCENPSSFGKGTKSLNFIRTTIDPHA